MSPALSVGRHIVPAHWSGLSSLARPVAPISVRAVWVRAVPVGVSDTVVGAVRVTGRLRVTSRLRITSLIAGVRGGEPGSVTGGVGVARPACVEILAGRVGREIGRGRRRRRVPAIAMARQARHGRVRSRRLPDWRLRVASAGSRWVAPVADVGPRPVLGVSGSGIARVGGWGAVHVASVGIPGRRARRRRWRGRTGRRSLLARPCSRVGGLRIGVLTVAGLVTLRAAAVAVSSVGVTAVVVTAVGIATGRMATGRMATGRMATGRMATGRMATGGVVAGGLVAGGVVAGAVVAGGVVAGGVVAGGVVA